MRLQHSYDKDIAPFVIEVIAKCRSILGKNHEVIKHSEKVADYARTNYLGMKDMANSLENLREISGPVP